MSARAVRISGEVRFPRLERALLNARIRVRVDDVSRADAAASTVASTVAGPVSAESGASPSVPYALELRHFNPQASYAVAALADLDGDGQISKGDFATTQWYPVLTRGNPSEVDIDLTEI